MPDTPMMRHLEMNNPHSGCHLAPARNETDDHQPLTFRSELYDLEESELACREVASHTITAESGQDEIIDSPLAPHYKHSATSARLVNGAEGDIRIASECLNQSLIRFSLSSDGGGDVQDQVTSNSTTGNAKAWIRDFECQAGAIHRLDTKSAPPHERRDVSTAGQPAVHVSDQALPPSRSRAISSADPSSTPARVRAEQRPYTNLLGLETPIYLGTPDSSKLSPGSSRDPSEVSDAGHQLGLRSKRTRSSVSESAKSRPTHRSAARLSSNKASKYELQKKILAAFKKTQNSHGINQEFLPNGDLYELVNPLTVGQELRNQMGHMHTPNSIDSFTKQICGESRVLWCGKSKIKTYRKIFALLVLVGVTASTPFFLEEDISDLDLPLSLPSLEDDEEVLPLPRPLDRLEDLNWSPVQMRTFQEYQWKMLAPFFAKGKHGDVKHYRLQEEHILPFLTKSEEERRAEKKGGFARVIMVRIHVAHHEFHRSKNHELRFAVKQQLHMEDRATFEKEISVLKKFSGEGRGHKHIISLLATFEQFDKLNLLFYRADGDLFAFWDGVEGEIALTHTRIQWVAEQCEGLVEALFKVHKYLTFTKTPKCLSENAGRTMSENCTVPTTQNACKRVRFQQENRGTQNAALPRSLSDSSVLKSITSSDHDVLEKQYGRHGDINPGNILWYRDPDIDEEGQGGTLKIADFGQTEFNSLKSRTAPRDVANTLTYRPPECDKLGHTDLPVIRQRYDIWCLGCVFLEFVTWVLGGASLQRQFAADRLTPDIFINQKSDTFFQVNRNVETCCYDVALKPEVEKSINQLHQHQNCSEFCHELLNLIQYDMLVVDSSKRSTCDIVLKKLRLMLRRCRKDEDQEYATKASPWAATRRQGSASQPMTVRIEKATTLRTESESENPGQAAHAIHPQTRYAKRNERRNHRNDRGGFKSAQRSQMSRRIA